MKKIKIKATENEIQNTVCQYLQAKRYVFWRQNNTAIYDPRTKRFRKMSEFSRKGVSDVIAIKDSVAYFLEFKRAGSYQSKDQKKFEEDVTKAGGIYSVIRTLEDAKELGL